MDIKELNKKVDQLADLRKERDIAKGLIDKRREEFEQTIQKELDAVNFLGVSINEVQNELLAVLVDAGNKSWRTDKATVTVKTTTSYNIVDREKVMEQLKELKLDKEYTKVEFIPQIKVLFEEKKFDGVEETKKDFISVLVKKD